MSITILALDLGKFNSVIVQYDAAFRMAANRTFIPAL